MAKALHRNLGNTKQFSTIEMADTCRSTTTITTITTAADLCPATRGILQTSDISSTQSKIQDSNHLQGSILSLGSRSYTDTSDVQPLTNVHSCRYEECVKFHRIKTDSEARESPFSPLKNLFLYLVIVLLILWAVIYTVLNQFEFI